MPKPNIFQNVFLVRVLGVVLLVVGIALVLSFWSDVVVFFRGVSGMLFALIGLLILKFLK